MPWMLPLIAALFWFDSYRRQQAQPPLWIAAHVLEPGPGPCPHRLRAVRGRRGRLDGVAGRPARHGDLVTATARPRWAAQLATWAATACWAVGGYLVFVGVAVRGLRSPGPVGRAAVVAGRGRRGGRGGVQRRSGSCSVLLPQPVRRAAGRVRRVPGPGHVVADRVQSHQRVGADPADQLQRQLRADSGIFYPYLPDLPIARLMFLAGLAVAALGLLGLPARAGGLRLRRAAAAVTVAGLVAAGTAVGLAGTARRGTARHVHSRAARRGQRPADSATRRYAVTRGVPVCLHPAYRSYLPAVTAALGPLFREVGRPARRAGPGGPAHGCLRGRPGAAGGAEPQARRRPSAAARRCSACRSAILACPVALRVETAGQFIDQLRLLFAHAFVSAGPAAAPWPSRRSRRRCCGALACRSPPSPRCWPATDCRRPDQPARTGRGPRAGARHRAGVRRRASGSPRCRPPPGTPGWRPTWARCGTATSPWRSCHDRRRGTQVTAWTRSRPRPSGTARPRRAAAGAAVPGQPPGPGRAGRWRPGSAPRCGPRCTGTGAWPAAPPRSRCAAGDRDRGRRGHRAYHLRPVRRAGTSHRPVAALPAAGRRCRRSPRPRSARWPPGPRRATCPAARWP